MLNKKDEEEVLEALSFLVKVVEELEEIFTDFPAWMDYVEESKNVRYKYSKELPAKILPDGQLVRINLADYEMRSPIGWQQVVEKSEYIKLSDFIDECVKSNIPNELKSLLDDLLINCE